MWTLTKVLDKATAGFSANETIVKILFDTTGATPMFLETNLNVYTIKIS